VSEEGVSKRKKGKRPEIVTIGLDRIHLLLLELKAEMRSRDGWHAPLGILASLLFTILVSDFKPRLGLSAERWSTLAYVALLVTAGWTVWAVVLARRAKSIDDALDRICENALTQRRHYALLFLRAQDTAGVNRFLVYFDQEWGCYLLPFVRVFDESSDVNSIRDGASDLLAMPVNSIKVAELEGYEVSSDKISQGTKKLTSYLFSFYAVRLLAVRDDRFLAREFTVDATRYKWASVEEMLEDGSTRDRNGEVFRHIREHRGYFFGGSVPAALTAPIRDRQ
jgi:hypothetical protein